MEFALYDEEEFWSGVGQAPGFLVVFAMKGGN